MNRRRPPGCRQAVRPLCSVLHSCRPSSSDPPVARHFVTLTLDGFSSATPRSAGQEPYSLQTMLRGMRGTFAPCALLAGSCSASSTPAVFHFSACMRRCRTRLSLFRSPLLPHRAYPPSVL